jgi:hypothetical protein
MRHVITPESVDGRASRRPGGLLRGRRWGCELLRLLARLGVACDVVAASLVPVRAGDCVKIDHRDAKKLVRLYRAGALSFVQAPTPEIEGLPNVTRCRDDLLRG